MPRTLEWKLPGDESGLGGLDQVWTGLDSIRPQTMLLLSWSLSSHRSGWWGKYMMKWTERYWLVIRDGMKMRQRCERRSEGFSEEVTFEVRPDEEEPAMQKSEGRASYAERTATTTPLSRKWAWHVFGTVRKPMWFKCDEWGGEDAMRWSQSDRHYRRKEFGWDAKYFAEFLEAGERQLTWFVFWEDHSAFCMENLLKGAQDRKQGWSSELLRQMGKWSHFIFQWQGNLSSKGQDILLQVNVSRLLLILNMVEAMAVYLKVWFTNQTPETHLCVRVWFHEHSQPCNNKPARMALRPASNQCRPPLEYQKGCEGHLWQLVVNNCAARQSNTIHVPFSRCIPDQRSDASLSIEINIQLYS